MVADFHRLSRESQRVGQTLLDMVRHPLFNVSDIRSETIVHLLRKLERTFAETAVVRTNYGKKETEISGWSL